MIGAPVQGHGIQAVGGGAKVAFFAVALVAVAQVEDLEAIALHHVLQRLALGQGYAVGHRHLGNLDLQRLAAIERDILLNRGHRRHERHVLVPQREVHFDGIAVDPIAAVPCAHHDVLRPRFVDAVPVFKRQAVVRAVIIHIPEIGLRFIVPVVQVDVSPPVALPQILQLIGPAREVADPEGDGDVDIETVVSIQAVLDIEIQPVDVVPHGDEGILDAGFVPPVALGIDHRYADLADVAGQLHVAEFPAAQGQLHGDIEAVIRLVIGHAVGQPVRIDHIRLRAVVPIQLKPLLIEALPVVLLAVPLEAVVRKLKVVAPGILHGPKGEGVFALIASVFIVPIQLGGRGCVDKLGGFKVAPGRFDADGHKGIVGALHPTAFFIPNAQRVAVCRPAVIAVPPYEAVALPFVAGIVLVLAVLPLVQADLVRPGRKAGDGVIAAGGHLIALFRFVPGHVPAGDRDAVFTVGFGHGEVEVRVFIGAVVGPEALLGVGLQPDAIGPSGFKVAGGNGILPSLRHRRGIVAPDAQVVKVVPVLAPFVLALEFQLVSPDAVLAGADENDQVFAAGDGIVRVLDFKVGQRDNLGLLNIDGHDVAVVVPIILPLPAPFLVVPVFPFIVLGVQAGGADEYVLLTLAAEAVGPPPGGIVDLPVPVGAAPFAVPIDLDRRDIFGNRDFDRHILIGLQVDDAHIVAVNPEGHGVPAVIGHRGEAPGRDPYGIVAVPGHGVDHVFVALLQEVPVKLCGIGAVVSAVIPFVLFGIGVVRGIRIEPEIIAPPGIIIMPAAIPDFKAIIHIAGLIAFIGEGRKHRQVDAQVLALIERAAYFDPIALIVRGGQGKPQFGQSLVRLDVNLQALVRAPPGPFIPVAVISAYAKVISAGLQVIGAVPEGDAVVLALLVPGILPHIPVLIDAEGIRAGHIAIDAVPLIRGDRIFVRLIRHRRRVVEAEQRLSGRIRPQREGSGFAVAVHGIALGNPPDVQLVSDGGQLRRGDLYVLRVTSVAVYRPELIAGYFDAYPGVFVDLNGLYGQPEHVAPGRAREGSFGGIRQNRVFDGVFVGGMDAHKPHVAADPYVLLFEPVIEPGADVELRFGLILPAEPILDIAVVELFPGPFVDAFLPVVKPDPIGTAVAVEVDMAPDGLVRAGIFVFHIQPRAEVVAALDPEAVLDRNGVVVLLRRGKLHAVDVARHQIVGGHHKPPRAYIARNNIGVHLRAVVEAGDAERRDDLIVVVIPGRIESDIQFLARFDLMIDVDFEVMQLRQRRAAKQAREQQSQGQRQAQQLPVVVLHGITVLSQ